VLKLIVVRVTLQRSLAAVQGNRTHIGYERAGHGSADRPDLASGARRC
jgi:hypothetical protein